MKAYHRFEWNVCDIDFMTITDVQYYDADGNYSIDYEINNKGELPLMLKFQEPFNVKGFPMVYNYLTGRNMDYGNKTEYIRKVINEFGELLLDVGKVMMQSSIEQIEHDKNIEGYQ